MNPSESIGRWWKAQTERTVEQELFVYALRGQEVFFLDFLPLSELVREPRFLRQTQGEVTQTRRLPFGDWKNPMLAAFLEPF